MNEWIECEVLSFYSKSWPSVNRKKKQERRRKTEWWLYINLSLMAVARHCQRRSNGTTRGEREKCQGKKNKYHFFSSPFVSFIWTKKKTNYEHIWQVIESYSFHSISSFTQTDGRIHAIYNASFTHISIDHLYLNRTKSNRHVFHTLLQMSNSRQVEDDIDVSLD